MLVLIKFTHNFKPQGEKSIIRVSSAKVLDVQSHQGIETAFKRYVRQVSMPLWRQREPFALIDWFLPASGEANFFDEDYKSATLRF